tara:strand:- start:207 stop:392 length:186 start_codon:yes stop_codon:yes gene_type:complete
VYQATQRMTERPEVLLSRADYIEDIKVRWQIHQFEVKKLQEDLSLVMNAITDKAFYMATDQ